MANLAPYRAAMEQLEWNKPNVYIGPKLSNQNSSHFENLAHQPFSIGGSPQFSTNDNRISATTSGSSGYFGNVRVNPYPTSDNIQPLTCQEQIVMTMETRQDDSISAMHQVLNSRQIENKVLEENLKNINKKLSKRAQTARAAAHRTRLMIKYFLLVRKTESTRVKKEDTADNVKYLDSVDGNCCHAEIKMELKAKKKAVMFLHSDYYRFNRRAGLAAYTKNEVSMKHRTSATRLSPFV